MQLPGNIMSMPVDQSRSHETGYAVTATDSQNSSSVRDMWNADEELVGGTPNTFPNQILGYKPPLPSSLAADPSSLWSVQ